MEGPTARQQATRASALRRTRTLRSDADDKLRFLGPLLQGVAATLGSAGEVVLHDFRKPEHSIVAIAGNVTGRRHGGSMSQIGLSLLAQGAAAKNQINYITETPAGRILKSSTIVLRDNRQRVFGAFCINIDVTDIRRACKILSELAGETVAPEPTTFTNDIRQVIEVAITRQLQGRTIRQLARADRIAIFAALEAQGAFTIQRAVSQVAKRLGVSRATSYSYLEHIRNNGRNQESP